MRPPKRVRRIAKLERLACSESSSGSSLADQDLTQGVDSGCEVRYDLLPSSQLQRAEFGGRGAGFGDTDLGRKNENIHRVSHRAGVKVSEESRVRDTMTVERAGTSSIVELNGGQYWSSAPFAPSEFLKRSAVLGTNHPWIYSRPSRIPAR